MNSLLIFLGKFIIFVSRVLNLGHGSTWPGHVALSLNKNFIKELVKANPQLKIILIAGTNGKTTTGKLVQTILEKSGKKVFQNEAGSNLLSGIASSLILHSNILSTIHYDYAIFEVDENTLPLILKELTPNYLILLNLFRDQLDRYGEVNTIASKWRDAIHHLLPKTQLILNADDPQIVALGLQQQWIKSLGSDRIEHRVLKRSYTSVFYFGLSDKKLAQTKHQHAVDSTYCPDCGSKLSYNTTYYSHLGDWECKNCELKRPNLNISNIEHYPVSGTYNRYNTLAAVLLAKQIDISQKTINSALHEFTPAFGRQEILEVYGKKAQIFLSKNPTSFNESLRTVASLGAKHILIVLNDRIPDGRDVSWIWDVDFEDYLDKLENIFVSGDRVYDLALRIKYANQKSKVKDQKYNSKLKSYEDLNETIMQELKIISQKEILYILATYSAMLEVRRILTGKKIL